MVPSAPKPHAPPSVTRASPSSIAFGGVARSARIASASSAVEATAPRPTRRQRAFALASPRRLRASASRQASSTSAPSRLLLAKVFPNDVRRSETKGGSAPPRNLRPSSASRSVTAETSPPRSGARSRRVAARPPAIAKPGGVCSHAAPFQWLAVVVIGARRRVAFGCYGFLIDAI